MKTRKKGKGIALETEVDTRGRFISAVRGIAHLVPPKSSHTFTHAHAHQEKKTQAMGYDVK
jgi:hypothetical protein